jgi:tetratricopeptide (TPR) repeat protein
MTTRKTIFFLFLSLSLGVFLCLDLPDARAGDCTGDCKKQFEFAESLFEENDYFRAISEYKRFIFLYPGSSLSEHCYLRICEAYYGAGRWNETVTSFETFISRFPRSLMLDKAYYLKGMAEKNLILHDEAISSFEVIIENPYSGEYRNKAYYQIALIYVEQDNWSRAREYFSKISDRSTLFPPAAVFSSGLEDINDIPQKSPALAGTMAAIIPGSGHLYTERPRDALVAFLLNATFIWAAIELFNDENYVAGGIVTFFELGWYTGNIYSAVSSAHKYNKRMKDDFIRDLKNRTSVSYFYNDNKACHYVMLNMKF